MQAFRAHWCLFLIAFCVVLTGCEAKIPEFAGVYALQDGTYKEVSRFKDFKRVEFNHQNRGGIFGGTDCNVKSTIPKDNFVVVDQATFAKKGFLVVQNKEWSDFKLLRVPIEGYLKDNEKGTEIVVGVGFGGGMLGMPFSTQGLIGKASPKEVEIKQAKKGENAFIYVPSMPPEKGFYLVDYKLNGQGHLGYNPILVK